MLNTLLRSIRGVRSERQLVAAAVKYIASVKALPEDVSGDT